jgi:predicted phage terminase large subunit-like protein
VSYSADLAGKHARDCRRVMESDWYRRIFPGTRLSIAKNTEMDFETTEHGYRYSTSIGGTLTGRGGNIIIIDDSLKAEEALSEVSRSRVNEFYDRTLYSRLDDKLKNAIILVQQRLHVDDLVGHVLQKEKWTHLNLPAIAEVEQQIPIGKDEFYRRRVGELLHEARESRQDLDQLKLALDGFNFSAQYQQCPVPPEGEIIKWQWFRSYDELPPGEPEDRVIQSWDTASKAEEMNDYSVCTTWLVKGNDYYLIDVLREKLIYPELKRRIVSHAVSFNANSVIIEDKCSGTSLIQDLGYESTLGFPRPTPFSPETDKLTRMSAQSARIEAGQVHLPRAAKWLDDFRTELLQFPHGKYDDQVDSLSQFLNWVEQRPRNSWTVQPFLL